MVDILKEKSMENMRAFTHLISAQEPMLASSIHCSYYACFQLIKYVLCHKSSYGYKAQNNDVKQKKISTHTFILSKITEDMERRNFGQEDINEFRTKIQRLKYFRTKADYTNKQINLEEVQCIKKDANEIISLIKEKYRI